MTQGSSQEVGGTTLDSPAGEPPDAAILSDLIEAGMLLSADAAKVAGIQIETGALMTDVILTEALVTETHLLRYFASKDSVRFVTAEKLRNAVVTDDVLARIPVGLAQHFGVLPLSWDTSSNALTMIAAAPVTASRLADFRQQVGATQITYFVATWSAVLAAISRTYHKDENAFADFSSLGAVPPMFRAVSMPPAEEVSRTKVLYQSAQANIVGLRQENVRFRIAQEFHHRVSQLNSVEEQIEAIVELVFDMLDADLAVIQLDSGLVAFRSSLENPIVELPQSLVLEATNSEDGILLRGIGLQGGRAVGHSVVLRGVQSALVVPLRSPDRLLGVLYLESLSAPTAFDENDQKMVNGVAAQAAALIRNAELLARVAKETEARTNLSRFLAPELVDQAVGGSLDLKLERRTAEATILYADIRGFTEVTEKVGASDVFTVLGGFYEAMTEAVFDEGGMVDKFMGDCVMAVWGAPLPWMDHASRAIRAAKSMIERSRQLVFGGAPLQLGIGISTGLVVVGAIGGKRRMDYTVIGSAVNVAARLCDVARGGQILAADETIQHSDLALMTEPLPPTPLKGVETDVQIHLITDFGP